MKIRLEKALTLAVTVAVSLFSMSFIVHQNAAAVAENDFEKWLAVGAGTGLAALLAGRKMLTGSGEKKDRDNKRLGCCGIIAVITAAVIALVVLKQNDVF